MISTASKVQIDLKVDAFRPIYYLGCKAGFTSAIKAAIDHVDPSGGRIVDLFAGTGSVGAAIGAEREVTTVDIQEYSRVLSSAMLCPSRFTRSDIEDITIKANQNEVTRQVFSCISPLIEYETWCINRASSGHLDELAELIESAPLSVRGRFGTLNSSLRLEKVTQQVVHRLQEAGLWHSPNTTVLRYFGGLYFSYTQAVMLDAILNLSESSGQQHRDTLMAAALSSASQLVNTVGKQFAQPIQPRGKSGTIKPSFAKVVQRDRSMDVLKLYKTWLAKYTNLPGAIGRPEAIRQDYLEALVQKGASFSVVYADPPYTRDHYSRFYHVLETMCLRDNPEISQVVKDGKLVPSRGAYRENRHQSEFCIRSTAPNAFDALFKTARMYDLPLVLSYSPHEIGDGTHPRVVSMDQIMELANEHYDKVELCVVDGVSHNKLNNNELKLKTREHAEVLVKCFR